MAEDTLASQQDPPQKKSCSELLCVSKRRLADCITQYAKYSITQDIPVGQLEELLIYIAVYPVSPKTRDIITGYYIALINELDDHEFPVDTFLEIADPNNVCAADIKTLESTLQRFNQGDIYCELLMFTAALNKYTLFAEVSNQVYTSLILVHSRRYSELMLIGDYVLMSEDVLQALNDANADPECTQAACEVYQAQQQRSGLVVPTDVILDPFPDNDTYSGYSEDTSTWYPEYPEDTYVERSEYSWDTSVKSAFDDPSPFPELPDTDQDCMDESPAAFEFDEAFSTQLTDITEPTICELESKIDRQLGNLIPVHRTERRHTPMTPNNPLAHLHPNYYSNNPLEQYNRLATYNPNNPNNTNNTNNYGPNDPDPLAPLHNNHQHYGNYPRVNNPYLDYPALQYKPYSGAGAGTGYYPPLKAHWHKPLTFNDAVHSAQRPPEPPLDTLFFAVLPEDTVMSDISVA